jgi:hypothetical protein
MHVRAQKLLQCASSEPPVSGILNPQRLADFQQIEVPTKEKEKKVGIYYGESRISFALFSFKETNGKIVLPLLIHRRTTSPYLVYPLALCFQHELLSAETLVLLSPR